MEELQSTEVLEREILEDARKKALRTLKLAEDTITEKTAEWDKKTLEKIGKIDRNYQIQKEQISEKIMSRLPIDKLRFKVDRIETLLKEAMEDWYKNTSDGEIIKLLSGELTKRLDICKGIKLPSKKKVYYSGMELKNAQAVLKESGLESVSEADTNELKSANPYPCIIVETDNTRITASIQNIIDFFLDVKREELVEALL